MRRRFPASVATLLTALSVAAAGAGEPTFQGITPAVDKHLQAREVAGAVTAVVTPKAVLHLEANGHADLASGAPMKPDSIFWIASMTKPITGVAVMMMQEEGKLSIDDAVSKYLPELGRLRTRDGTAHAITIKQLLTHTSGLGEISPDEDKKCLTLADAVRLFAGKPLQFVPGTQWRYSQSSINTAARVVEVVSGLPFEEFVEKRLFGPLGMKDTAFYLTAAQEKRVAKSYARTPDGKLEEAPNFMLNGLRPSDRNRFPHANGGLFSTAPDYAHLARMILNDGKLDGRRYLKPESVKALMTVHSGELQTGFTPGNGWGLGWCVIRTPQGVTSMLSPGTAGHGGAYGTQAWIDPVKKRAYILMVQRSNFPNADASELRRDFQQAVVDSLDK